MPRDRKYGQVTLENQRNIGDDEPVFVFRAQDKWLPLVLEYYRSLCDKHGSPLHHLQGINDATREVVAWQSQHEPHTPQSELLKEN